MQGGAKGRDAQRIAFVSSNSMWGGSEELWSAAAAVVARRGHRVVVAKSGIEPAIGRIAALQALRVPVTDLRRLPLLPRAFVRRMIEYCWPLDHLVRHLRFAWFLRRAQPDFAILSQGGNLDGRFYGSRLRRAGIRYALIVQKAAEMYWPTDAELPGLIAMYRDATRVFFVSEHNRRLTEEQLGLALPNAEVVRNPFLVAWDAPVPWPDAAGPLRLACVGRLYPREKGQDIVLRVLARPKWRERAVEVTFYGAGPHAGGLRRTADHLGLTAVGFGGFSGDIAALWKAHHGLILPSHCEGLPLVLVEAMLSGRVPIVTDVAGNAELVRDGETGFLAAAPTDDAVDAALERAWRARGRWPAIGVAAAAAARAAVPPSPETSFADRVLALLPDTPAP